MGIGGSVQIEVIERETPVFGGSAFGAVGTYERLHGRVFGELDPAHHLNAGIVNLGRAALNARGNVEYQSDFRILKPLDLDRGNGCSAFTGEVSPSSCLSERDGENRLLPAPA